MQNFRVSGGVNSGIYSFGAGNTIQNNDVSQISSDGDTNGITFFGDDIRILLNDIHNLLKGSPNGSHTDGIQTWNTASKRSSSRVLIFGNRIRGPVQSDPAYIHQGVMAEGKDSTDGGGGGTGVSQHWLVDSNEFQTYGNQALKFDDIHDVKITRNIFSGSATKVVETGDLSTGTVFYGDNKVTGSYGSIGVAITDGAGPTASEWGSGSTPPPPPVVDPPPAAKLPAQVLDLSKWKLTLPIKGDGTNPKEIKQPALATETNDWFKVVGDGVAFRGPVNGFTTSGSSYPRSELREMNSDGSQASWASNDGKVHTLTVTEAFNHLPNTKPHLVGAQIHDASDDISVFRLEGSKLYVTNGNDAHAFLADANYVLGTKYEAKFVVAGGKVQAFYNGKLVATIVKDFSGAYFKAGAYTQANCTNSSPCSADNYGETIIYSLAVSHVASTDPGPGTPPPPPPGNPPVVMIIRHGEKPADKNDHTLSPIGKQRAEALPSIFVTPKAGLFKPSWIFASKGATSSMRMLQTAQPTANDLGLTVDTRYDSENAVAETAKLLVDQAKAGEVVLAVLEHSALPAVAKALGKSSPSVPSTWPDDRFDEVWVFVGDGKGGWTFTQVPELVLSGDKSTPI